MGRVTILSKFVAFMNRNPILRGMVSYGVIWPTSSIIQQTISGKTWENYDWMKVLRMSLYGAFFQAPTLYAFVRITSIIWPESNIRTALIKVFFDQFVYEPVSMTCFFFGMSLMEGKSIEEAKEQVKRKFIPSYKASTCFWPVLQTINFCFVPEKNRVPFMSVCGLVWCVFLSYMHQLQIKNPNKPSDQD